MNIKYNVHTINNSGGSGEARVYARAQLARPISPQALEQHISHSCTLTAGDIRAVLASLEHIMAQELAAGHRFHLPGIGYFAPKVSANRPLDRQKIRGTHLYTSTIRFSPEAQLLRRVKADTHYERMQGSTGSVAYTPDEMGKKITAYLESHRLITRKDMEEAFGLRKTTAQRWLATLREQGIIVREGTRKYPVYFKAAEGEQP